MRRVQKAEEVTTKGGATLAVNQLFERCNLLLNSCPDVIPWTMNINNMWNQHQTKQFGKVFQEKVAEYLMMQLRAAKANFETRLVSKIAKTKSPSKSFRKNRTNHKSNRRRSELYSDNDADKNKQLVNKPKKVVKFKPTVSKITTNHQHTYDSEKEEYPDLEVQFSSSDESQDDDSVDTDSVFSLVEEPQVNAVTSELKVCDLCDEKPANHTWQCKLFDNCNIGEDLKRKIKLSRIKHRNKLVQQRTSMGLPVNTSLADKESKRNSKIPEERPPFTAPRDTTQKGS